MATFWEIAARSVSNLFSLYFVYLSYLFISRFGFKSGICLLIAPVPVHCVSITFLISPVPGQCLLFRFISKPSLSLKLHRATEDCSIAIIHDSVKT